MNKATAVVVFLSIRDFITGTLVGWRDLLGYELHYNYGHLAIIAGNIDDSIGF